MPIPLIIPLAIAAASAGLKASEAAKQRKLASKLANKARPELKVSKAEEDAYKAARFNYGTSASNIQEAGRNELDNTFANTVTADTQAATDSSGLLAALTAAQGAKNRANIQLDNNAIGQKQNDLNSLLSASHAYSSEQNKAWDWNKKMPYEDAMLAASSLTKASKENAYGAVNDFSNIAISAMMNNTGGGNKVGVAGATNTTGAANGGDYTTATGVNPSGAPFSTATGAGSMTQASTDPLVVARNAYSNGSANAYQISLLKANGLVK